MFEIFTEKAIKVIMLAQEETRRLGHNYVGTEQILLGLIAEGTGVAAKVLWPMGVTLKDARIEVEKNIGRGSGFVAPEIPFTPRAKRALELSLEESRYLGHDYIDTEHLLLGLISGEEGVGIQVLKSFHVNLQALRRAVLLQLPHKPNVGQSERFTEKAIKIIILAQEESRRLGHNFVGTEQILLGLIGEGTGGAAKVLQSRGINLKDARIEVEKIIGRGSGVTSDKIPFSSRAKRVLELSLEQCRHLGHNYISTEHLLLGLICVGEGIAVQVLESLHVNLQILRKSTLQLLLPLAPGFIIEFIEYREQNWENLRSSPYSFLVELAEHRQQLWENYHNSLEFVNQLEKWDVYSSTAPTANISASSVSALGSGQPPDELRLSLSAIEAESETVRRLEAEIEDIDQDIEEDIEKAVGKYMFWGVAFLLVGVSIWLWHKGWLVQVLIVSLILGAIFKQSLQRQWRQLLHSLGKYFAS